MTTKPIKEIYLNPMQMVAVEANRVGKVKNICIEAGKVLY